MLAIALIIGTAAATSPQASKLHASRMVPAQPALPKVLELRGGGMVPGDLVVKATQAVFGGYGLALLARPDLVSRLLFLRQASPSRHHVLTPLHAKHLPCMIPAPGV